MKAEETICYRVSRLIDMLENALSGRLNIIEMGKQLHEVRESAIKMEAGLKLRREIMEKNNLEKQYQKKKGEQYIVRGINKYAKRDEVRKQDPQFEFILKEKGEIVYQNKVHAAVFSVVEKISDIDEMGVITGDTQKMMFGHRLSQWFAFDQLRQAIEARSMEILTVIKSGMLKAKLGTPLEKEKFIKALNA